MGDNMTKIWMKSCFRLKNLRVQVFCGLMGALAIVLDQFSVALNPFVKIGFSGLPNRLIDYLFGPAVGALFGAVMDVVKFIIKPDGTFQPAFTLVPIVASVIYGYFLFEKPLKLWRVALSQLIVKIVCNICMNTFLMSVLYGSALGKILPMRALRNLVMWPIDTLVMFVLLTAVDRMLLPLMRREHWL